MSDPASQALRDALALRSAPRGPRPGPEEPLPAGMLQLIRIAAGEEESLASAQAATAEPAATIREAATFYIQQVLFAPASSSFRVMGVDADESDERIREHYRWLARWLHPDRNADAWEVVFAERVNQAWQDLRTPERRERYELQRREQRAELAAQGASAAAVPGRFVPAYAEPAVARRPDLRWLPNAILGSLAILAIGGVALYYAVQLAEKRRAPAIVAAVELSEVRPSPVENREPPPFEPAPAELVAFEPAVAVESNAEPAITTDLTVPTSPALQEPAEQPPPSAPPPPPPVKIATSPPPTPKAVPAPTAQPDARTTAPTREAQAAEPAAPSPASTDSTVAARPAVRAPSAGSTSSPSGQDANRLLNRFSSAYEQGDLARMRSLFTADARGPRGGVDKILADYDRVFETSRERSLAVRDVTWFVSGDTLTIVASYQATVTTARSGKQRRTQGDIRMDLRRQDNQWHIYRLQHDERPG